MVLRITVLASVVALTACANSNILYNPYPQRMSTADLNYFKYDCAHIEEQRAFLKTQLSYISPYEQNSVDRAIILRLLSQEKYDCPAHHPVAQTGCVNVREDTVTGSATATVCYVKTDSRAMPERGAPIINHWDPLVDMK
jgi:hypothetical protein